MCGTQPSDLIRVKHPARLVRGDLDYYFYWVDGGQ
jgi:hypothetical protein